MFDNDVDVLNNPSEEYNGFVRAVVTQLELAGKMISLPPWYRLYNNKLSRDFARSSKVNQWSYCMCWLGCVCLPIFLDSDIYIHSKNT